MPELDEALQCCHDLVKLDLALENGRGEELCSMHDALKLVVIFMMGSASLGEVAPP
jgi:hypothetical protein